MNAEWVEAATNTLPRRRRRRSFFGASAALETEIGGGPVRELLGCRWVGWDAAVLWCLIHLLESSTHVARRTILLYWEIALTEEQYFITERFSIQACLSGGRSIGAERSPMCYLTYISSN